MKLLFSQASPNANWSQYYFKNFPNTPSTATFLRYGDIQNSEYTGTNSPEIFLYNIETGSIKVPLSLKYISGNGVKVTDQASYVGLGWGMSFPTITQFVMGYDDLSQFTKLKLDFTYNNTSPVVRANQYFEVCDNAAEPSGFIQQPGINKFDYYKTFSVHLPINGVFGNYNNDINYDTSPDIFTCSLFGEKLQFVTSNFQTVNANASYNPTFYCLNKKGYKITYNSSDLFTIKDPTGISYYFSQSEIIGATTDIRTRNFVLTKIKDQNNNELNISYNNYSVTNIPIYSQNLNFTYGYSQNYLADIPPNYIDTNTCKHISGYTGEYEFSTSGFFPYGAKTQINSFFTPSIQLLALYQNVLQPATISWRGGNINFSYSGREDTATQKLDKLTVNSNAGKVKEVNFNYDYFISQSSNTVRFSDARLNIVNIQQINSMDANLFNKRLKLISLKINEQNPYTFNYNTIQLPARDSFAVDYWGYFNGGLTNKTYFLNPTDFDLSSYSIPIDNFYNNNFKQADLNFAKAAVLTKITYPTQGYSLFEYELNTANNIFSNEFSPTQTIGNGLRLKSQNNYSSSSQLADKTVYTYENGNSTNPLFLIKRYLSRAIELNSRTQALISMISFNANNNNSASPLSSGDYIGYNKVTKQKVDENGNTLGKTETNFQNTSDFFYSFYDNQVPVNMPSITANDIENGKVLSQSIYDSSNTKLSEINNIYSNILSNIYYGVSLIKASRFVLNNSCVAPTQCSFTPAMTAVGNIGYYPIFSKESLLMQSIKKEFISNKEFTTQTSYSYSPQNNMLLKLVNHPDGIAESTTLSYANDMNDQRLINANMISIPLQKTTSKGGQDYSFFRTRYDDISHLNPTSVTETSQVQLPNYYANTRTIVAYTTYDDKGNLQEYRDIAGIPTTIVWGYNQTLPIAKIEGATYTSVSQYLQDIINKSNLDVDTTSEQTLIDALDILRKRSEMSNYQITTYTYNPLIGVTTVTPPSGIREKYIYDTSNRLLQVIDLKGKILKENEYNYKH